MLLFVKAKSWPKMCSELHLHRALRIAMVLFWIWGLQVESGFIEPNLNPHLSQLLGMEVEEALSHLSREVGELEGHSEREEEEGEA